MTRTAAAALALVALAVTGCSDDDSDTDPTAADRDAMVGALLAVDAGGDGGPEELRCIADELLEAGVTVEQVEQQVDDPDVVDTYRQARDDCGAGAGG